MSYTSETMHDVPVDLTAAQTGRSRVTRRFGHSFACNAALGPDTAAREVSRDAQTSSTIVV